MQTSNEILKEFLDIKEKIKVLKKRQDEIHEFILYAKGFETPDFIAAIKNGSRSQIASIKEFEVKFGPFWLRDNNMIKTIEFKIVDVVKRPKNTF